ncbi:MAG: membrane protein insertase YidC [Desulfamplus sp.]|nr:membrane protein insertase YidC [Desulfamplus sp.]
MDEQKRLFIAIILSIVVIVGWNFFFVPPQTVNQQEQQNQQSGFSNSTDGSTVNNTDAASKDLTSNGSDAKEFNPSNSLDSVNSPNNGLSELQESSDFKDIKITTPIYDITISEKRAAVTSLTLKKFKEGVEKESPFKQMVPPELTSGLFTFDFEEKSVAGLDRAVFKSSIENSTETTGSGIASTSNIAKITELILNEGETKIIFSWTSPHGIVVEKIYTISASTYLIGLDVVIKNGSSVPLKDSLEISMPFALTKEGAAFSQFGAYGPEAYINGSLQIVTPKDIQDNQKDKNTSQVDENTLKGIVEWAGNGDRYFISCLMPVKPVESSIKLSGTESLVLTRYIQSMERLDPNKQIQLSFQCYMGPKSLKVLGDYKNNLKKAIDFGWFDVLAKPCLILMNLIHEIIPNYGVAIILLTILIKLLFWPLGTKSYKSMNDMKKLQPLMNQIRDKYKDDKQKMNQEVMNLYKTYKVNPMSGCLPMVVQMPIFFALYRMLYQAIELRHAPFMGWINDLSAPDRLFHFNLAIPFMHPPYGIPVLTIIMGATMFLQQKMSPTMGDPTQAKVMMFMPLFMTVIFINFPSGLVLYWLVNNILSIGQQYYTQKKFL